MVAIPTEVVTFASGGSMPLVGFGTWQLRGHQAVEATAVALDAGYRHLDTAAGYRNEAEIGRALAEAGVPRDDVFVTTKCPPSAAGRERDTLRQSLENLGTDRVDLWLVHWSSGDAETDLSLWRALVDAQADGLARDIGVSNFSPAQIDALVHETATTPVVNQVEWSPLLYDGHLLQEHQARGVTVEGYSGLKGGTLDHPTVTSVAGRLGRTPAQVIVRWHLQHGVVVIPKSGNPERIRQNADVAGFELTGEDMEAIDGLGSP